MNDVDDEIARRQFDTDRATPAVAVVETVSELEDVDSSDLTTIYSCIDHMIDHLFSEPPSPDADVTVEFTYEGYRISIEQDGSAEFRPLEAEVPGDG